MTKLNILQRAKALDLIASISFRDQIIRDVGNKIVNFEGQELTPEYIQNCNHLKELVTELGEIVTKFKNTIPDVK